MSLSAWSGAFVLVFACSGRLLSSAEEAMSREVLIICLPPSSLATVPRAPASAPSAPPGVRHRGDMYRAVLDDPDQTFIDSELGPMPLWSESVYDGLGHPVPRFPDIYAKAFFDDPTPATARAYLESQRARARRYLEASAIMRQTAVEYGYVTPDAFRPPMTPLANSRALHPPQGYEPEDAGFPMLSHAQAQAAGQAGQEIPRTPGRTTTRNVEVIYIWDRRCPYSVQGMKDMADVAKDIATRQLGPRVLTVSLDNDAEAVQAELSFLDYTGVQTQWMENYTDQTDLRRTLHITRTPTYILLDRRRGRLMRFEGEQDAAVLQQALLRLVDAPDAEWSRADPALFRPVSRGDGNSGAAAPPVPEASPPLSSPILAPSRPYPAWDPDGQRE